MQSLFNNPYANLASKGRYGDTMLAHVNPQEAAMLQSMGGAGTVNPQTGLPEFFSLTGFSSLFPPLEPLPSLGQALNPTQMINVVPQLGTVTTPATHTGGLGFKPASEQIAPEYSQYADKQYTGMGGVRVTGYTVPTEQTFQGKPLEAKYDEKGSFINLQIAGGDYLPTDPNQPNIVSSPKINAKGEIIDYGVFDLSKQDNGSFGSFIGGLAQDFAPMILAGLGANALAGSGLFSPSISLAEGAAGGAAAGSGALSPYAAQAAGAYGGSAAAAAAAAAGSLTGITNAALAQNTLTADALARTGLTYGGNLTPASIPTTPTTTGSGSPMAGVPTPPVVTLPTVTPAVTPAAVSSAASSITPSMLDSIATATGIKVDTLKTFAPSVIQGLIGATGSVLTANQAKDAAQTQSDAQIRAAQIAADAARFRPVGVTTRFGQSNFTTDAAGNIVTAGYTPSAEITGYQDRLKTLTGQGLTDVEAARAAYLPLTTSAQSLFTLGKEYLAKTPEKAAEEYITKQQALLAPSQQTQLAELRNRQFQTGRGGVATSQGGNLMNTNPEMAAYYNSIAQQNLVLAAQADQEARNRITYGAGLFDTGANLQGRYYTGQTAAYSPFTTAMDTSSGLERLAQQPLDLSTAIGSRVSTANANVGQLTGQGIINAASTMAPANAYSIGGNLLAGAANSPNLTGALNNAFGVSNQPTITQEQLINILLGNKQKSAFVA